MGPLLLIDGRNAAYRTLFAGLGDQRFAKSGYHMFVIWMRFAHTWLEKFNPQSIHVFWDCPGHHVWRNKIFNEYKDGRGYDHPEVNIPDEINKICSTADALLKYMNHRTYIKDNQEADDLIYSFCRVTYPQESIIISSDTDMSQISWWMPNVKCFDPRKKKFIEHDGCNPAVQKALVGDKSDNIEGYRGIGPVKGKKLASDLCKLSKFLDENGSGAFKKNLSLIDLSHNPYKVSNDMYIVKQLSEEPIFDKSKIMSSILEHKVRGLQAEYPRIVSPFKQVTA